MCTCSSLPASVAAIPEDWPGVQLSQKYFELPDPELFDHSVTWEHNEYKCTGCGQHWYGESIPEEFPELKFAMKVPPHKTAPAPDEIRAAKEALSVIAHGGFDAQLCKVSGCKCWSLKGRYVCHQHYTFP